MTIAKKTEKFIDFKEVKKLVHTGDLINVKLVFDLLLFSFVYEATYTYKKL